MKKINKKGAYGIDIVTEVALGLFILLLVIVALIIGAYAILTPSTFPAQTSSSVDSLIQINSTGVTLIQSTLAGFSNPTITLATGSAGQTIPSTNYTLVGNIIYNATNSTYNNVNLTYSYQIYTSQRNLVAGNVQNLTTGASSFFGSSSTFFGILVVVVIMIFLGLMIGAVMLFRGRNKSSIGR